MQEEVAVTYLSSFESLSGALLTYSCYWSESSTSNMILLYNLTEADRVLLRLLSLIWLFSSVSCFGWTAWNNNLLQSISDCPTFDGNRTGICVTSAAECRNSK